MYLRKIQNLGFSNDYKNNLQIRNILKLFLNLPYFKLDRLTEAYQYIKTTITLANKQREFSLFLVYYERNFSGNIEQLSIYSQECWNVFSRIVKNAYYDKFFRRMA
ncbi:hypothetical protein DMUE_2304 [Dictyocoela muelleri]|nr:hypothetical protein DMUE_2304 [Dictyocoela muelleri]